MRFLLITIFCLALYSCNSPKQDGWQLATKFHENHATQFIENQELLKYSYNPRSQFYYTTDDESRTFRCLNRDTIALIIINFGGFDIFQSEFELELETLVSFGRAELIKDSTSFKLIVNDSIPIKIISFGKDPIQYFVQLRQLIDEYRIVTYGKLRIGGIVEVYLTAFDYLLYFPTDYKIEEQQFEEYWRMKQKNGKKLDENWYYYKSEKPLDFG